MGLFFSRRQPSSRVVQAKHHKSVSKCRGVRPRVESLEERVVPLANCSPPFYIVSSAADSGSNTLRDAINCVNSPQNPGEIIFDIPGTGLHTIHLQSPLPAMIHPAVIEAGTQPGYDFVNPAIELDGSRAGPNANGFTISVGLSTIHAFAINNFSGSGILLQGFGENSIIGNNIGTDPRGIVARPNAVGITVRNNANVNCIGTTFNILTSMCDQTNGIDFNVISGNTGAGVSIERNITGTVVDNNLIGTDTLGLTAIPNGEGVVLSGGATGNTIGGALPSVGNQISGNRDAGVLIMDAQTTRNVVQNNNIGTDPLGAYAIPNQRGVAIMQATGNTIGGATLAATNIISGNAVGVFLGSGATLNQIANNCIGLDATGSYAVPNTQSGVVIQDSNNNTIGGLAGVGNQISGNRQDGVLITGSSSRNVLLGNLIGTDFGGEVAVPNAVGVFIQAGSNNVIGGLPLDATNLISGNALAGVMVLSSQSVNNQIIGNAIGFDGSLTQALPNGVGIMVSQAAVGTTIGGTAAGAFNLISGNATDGILVSDGARNTVIQGNGIGVTNGFLAALPNGTNGIDLVHAINTTIGGTAPFAGNLISGNTYNGILLINGTSGTLVQGNGIGVNNDLSGGIPNGTTGVAIVQSSNNTVGGLDPAAENFIGFNGNDGVLIDTGTGNTIRGNSITSDTHLGIELLDNANLSQPFPVITNAGFDTNTNLTTITGTLTAAPDTNYSVDIFANYVCSPSGYGEGLAYEGTLSVTTDDSGNGSFTFIINSALQGGIYMSATATDPAGNTSQFAACVLVTDQTGGDAPHGNPGDGIGLSTVVTSALEAAPAIASVRAAADITPVSSEMVHAFVESPAMNRDTVSVSRDDFFVGLQHEAADDSLEVAPVDFASTLLAVS